MFVTSVLATAFGFVALYPHLQFSELTMEAAVVKNVTGNDVYAASTYLTTENGKTVVCHHGRKGGCPPPLMRALQNSGASVSVWHDGETVYQLASNGSVVFPYSDVRPIKSIAAFVSLALFVAAGVEARRSLRNGKSNENAA